MRRETPRTDLRSILAGHRHADEGGAVRAWLEGLATTYLAYGADLVYELRCGDNVAQAERALLDLEAAGLIERGDTKTLDHRRTREIAFFGVGGQPGNESTSPVLYGFAPGATLAAELEATRAEDEALSAERARRLEERKRRAAAQSAAVVASRPNRAERPQINLAESLGWPRPYGGWHRVELGRWRLEQPGWGFSIDTLTLYWTDHAGWCWSWQGVGRAIGRNVTGQQAMRYAVDAVREHVAGQVDALRRIGITLDPDTEA